MFSMKPDPDIRVTKIRIGRIPALVLQPKEKAAPGPGVLWIHGGGYFLGMKEMVHMSRAVGLVKHFGAVVVAPGYRLAFQTPYPAALKDCYRTLLYMKKHAASLGFRGDQIMVGGESAGGGLAAALCMLARDRKTVNIAFQMPLYPMLDNLDTPSSGNNHGRVWNTRRNHFGWRMYLRGRVKEKVTPYASPARQTNYRDLPPAYSFVGDGEPFRDETIAYIRNLKAAGVPARLDIYPTDIHAFDMLSPYIAPAPQAVSAFEKYFAFAVQHYFAPQGGG